MQKGYSVVAYSDHNVMIPHTELIDENFVAITAGEYNFSDQYSRWPNDRQYHLNFFAKNKDQEGFIPFEMEYSTKNVIRREKTMFKLAGALKSETSSKNNNSNANANTNINTTNPKICEIIYAITLSPKNNYQ